MKNFTKDSFSEIRDVTFVSASPDGGNVLYAVSGECFKLDKPRSWLYVYDTAAAKSRRLTYTGDESRAEWLDGHTILFSADREKKKDDKKTDETVFYALDINGGEAREAFRVPVAGASAKPLGENRYLIYGIYDAACEGDGNKELYEVFDEHPYRCDGRGYVNKKRSRLYTFDSQTGELKAITDPLFQTNVIMNSRIDPILSGDKKRVYYWGETVENLTAPAQSVYEYDLEAGCARKLFDNETYMLMGGFELEGRVYFNGLVINGPGFYSSAILSAKPGETGHRLELSPDGHITGVSAADDYILVSINEHDKSVFYKLVPGGKLEKMCSPQHVLEGKMSFAGGKWYFTGRRPMDMRQLVEVSDGECRELTDVGRDFLAQYPFTDCEPVNVPRPEGHTVHGWVVKPHGFEPGKKYPGILMIHGGPQSAYLNLLNFTMQLAAARGYFVIFCNPRGSTNYGTKYMDLQGKFGTIDYEDIMAFTDAALEKYPELDGARLGVTGGSYGGYMTNWIIGHTDRFKGAVPQRSISNWVSMYGTSDIPYFVSWGQLGTPWVNIDSLWEHSPLKYADKCKTPALFLQNDRDYRCPVEQAEQMYTALKLMGVPSRMVLFHGASHGVMTPEQRRKNDEEMLAWMDKYVAPER